MEINEPNTVLTYEEFKYWYPNITALDCNFPKEIKLTTHTLIFKFPIFLDTKYIANNIPLSLDFVIAVKHGNSNEFFRYLIPCNKKKSTTSNTKKKSKKRKNFYFQTTLIIRNGENSINIKLFRNGTIQITGSKNISFVYWAIYKLFYIFYNEKESTYAKPFFNCSLSNILSFNIYMINSTFSLGFEINKDKAYIVINNYFKEKKDENFISCEYDPLRHSGIQIKYRTENSELTLILFETGKIIMSGSVVYNDIIQVYKTVMYALLTNYDNIKKVKYCLNGKQINVDNLIEQEEDEENEEEENEDENEEDEDEDEENEDEEEDENEEDDNEEENEENEDEENKNKDK